MPAHALVISLRWDGRQVLVEFGLAAPDGSLTQSGDLGYPLDAAVSVAFGFERGIPATLLFIGVAASQAVCMIQAGPTREVSTHRIYFFLAGALARICTASTGPGTSIGESA